MNTKKLCLAVISAFISLFIAEAQGKDQKPLMGWSSWNVYNININQEKIEKQAQALVDLGLKDLGYNRVNIDDGFWDRRDENGNLQINKDRFPEGLEPLVAKIKSLGLHPGIYSDAGVMSCAAIWAKDPHGIGVGLEGHVEKDAELYFNKMGFEYIKIDYCGAGDELNLNPKDQYTKLINAINKVAKNPITINICRWAYPGNWAKGMANAWRISYDIEPNWKTIKYIIDKNLYLSAYASKEGYNDMDMLEIGMGMPKNEEEAHMAIWSIMSSPLIIGCDLTQISEESLKLLKNKSLIAINQDELGKQAHVIQHNGEGYVLAKDLEKLRGNKRAIALYNPTDSAISIEISPREMGFEIIGKRDKLDIFDAINEKKLKAIKTNIKETLPPRSAKLYIIEGKNRIKSETKYEAEWAYISNYDDIPRAEKLKYPTYKSDEKASGKMVVSLSGGNNNSIYWNNVYVEEDGQYKLVIHHRPHPLRSKFYVDVNETNAGKYYFATEKSELTNSEFERIGIVINLRKGENKIALKSIENLLPDIDYIEVSKLDEMDIIEEM